MNPTEITSQLTAAPPVTLALILGLAALGVAALALVVVLRLAGKGSRR